MNGRWPDRENGSWKGDRSKERQNGIAQTEKQGFGGFGGFDGAFWRGEKFFTG